MFLDGGDGNGKDTVIQNFTSRLSGIGGYSYEVLHFPSPGPIGQVIYTVLKNPVEYAYILSKPLSLQLLFEADRYSMLDKFEAAKRSPKHILFLNRWWTSGIAYSKANGLRGKGLELVERLVQLYPRPDFGFILDTPVSVAQVRMTGRTLDSFESNVPLQVQVREELLSLARKHHFFVLDGNLPPGTLGKMVFDTVLNL